MGTYAARGVDQSQGRCRFVWPLANGWSADKTGMHVCMHTLTWCTLCIYVCIYAYEVGLVWKHLSHALLSCVCIFMYVCVYIYMYIYICLQVLPRLIRSTDPQHAPLLKSKFSGIFFDTYAENRRDLLQFTRSVKHLLAPDGRLSFFNGFFPHNIFYHVAHCRMLSRELAAMDLRTEFRGKAVQPDRSLPAMYRWS